MKDIDDLTLFIRIVQAGSLAGAGRQMGLSPASVTMRLKRLEAKYNTRLITRNTRSMALTDKGRALYDGSLKIVEQFKAIESQLADDNSQLQGRVSVSAPADFGAQYVAPIVSQFAQLHPDVQIHLNLSERLVDLVKDDIDLAFRFGNLDDSDLIAKKLVDNRRIACAAPSYFDSMGMPSTPTELLTHRCLILYRGDKPLDRWFYTDNGSTKSIRVSGVLATTQGAVIRQWALQGAGIALKSRVDVQQDLNDGKLVECLPQQMIGFNPNDRKSVGLQIVYASRSYQPKQVRQFIEFASDAIKRQLG